MATTIVTKNGTGAPTDSDLVAGELAVDLTNGRLYTTDLDSGGTVIEIGLNPSGNVDVTGTIKSASATQSTLYLSNAAKTNGFLVGRSLASNDAQDFFIYDTVAASTRLVIDASGNVGIGTSSPASKLHVAGQIEVTTDTTTPTAGSAYFYKSSVGATVSGFSAVIETGGAGSRAERMRIDSSGNVGIGTSNPDTTLHLETPNGTKSEINFSQTAVTNYRIGVPASTDALTFLYGASTERMRILADGSVCQGNTVSLVASNYNNQAGAAWHEPDEHYEIATTSNRAALEIGKNNANDGSLLVFRKQGTTVGSIGTNSGFPYFAAPANFSIMLATTSVLPRSNTGAFNEDGTVDLGASDARFKDLYLSGGVVFGATGGAVTSKTLDDYEEGTWTVTLNSGNGDATVSASNTTGYYVKIGNLVTVSWYSVDTNISAIGTGNARVSNLPFTAASGTRYYQGILTHTTAVDAVTGYIAPSSTAFIPVGTGTTSSVPLIAGNPRYIMFQATYETA